MSANQVRGVHPVVRQDPDDGAHDEIGLRFDVADDLISARDVRRHDSGDEATKQSRSAMTTWL